METLMNKAIRTIAACVLGGAALCGHAYAQSQNYPSRPIRIVVPYTPGGFNDTMARVVGKKLQDAWAQPVIVDNRPGGGTTIGTDHVAKSPADGYTLLVVGFPLPVNQFLYKKLPYDTAKDFAPVILGGAIAQRDGGQIIFAVSFCQRSGGRSQSQAGQTQLRIVGQWHVEPPDHGVFHECRGHQHDADPLQRQRADGDRAAR
jgi:hypothetical protein